MNASLKLNDENFDASQFETKEDFSKLLEESFKKESPEEGSVITGKIVSRDRECVVVDVGLKTEGRIPLREFDRTGEAPDVHVGDEVTVYLEKIENRDGEAVLSFEKAQREKSWAKLESDYGEGSIVDGVIFGRVKGGFTVDVEGVVAFLPGSQVDVRPVKDVSPLMGIKQPFQILKLDRARDNVVVSRRSILEESRSAERNELLDNINEGDVMEGVVKNITDYGAFVDLGVVDGLLHVTDISWRRVNHPSEVLKVGETIKAKVIKFDEKNKRISLGMKQLEDSPWQDIENRYPLNSTHKGFVTNIAEYGAFIELEPGVEGLVHMSEISWTKKNVHPSALLKASQEVDVMVLDIDQVKHRISLGVKQCQPNPWEQIQNTVKEGATIKGPITNINEFGLFVNIEGDLDGLVHVNDISWEKSGKEAAKDFEKGQEIEVKVLEVDAEKERISLGIKQLLSDPFADGGIAKGAVSTFTVTEVNDNGIEVEVTEGVKAFIKRSDLAVDRADQRPDKYAVGDRVDAKVTTINKAKGEVKLSVKALEQDQQKAAIKEYGSTDSGASLGDILGVALDSAKAEAESKPAKKKTAAKKKDEAKEADASEETSE